MSEASLDVIFSDSLEEFSKELGGKACLDLLKIESLAETSNQIKYAFKTIFPRLKFGEDVDIVVGLDSGLPIIEVYGRKDQFGIEEIKPINRQQLFEYIEGFNAQTKKLGGTSKDLVRDDSIVQVDKSSQKSVKEDTSNRQIPLDPEDLDKLNKLEVDKESPSFQEVENLPVFVTSISTENKQVHTIAESSEPGVPNCAPKFVVSDPDDVVLCQIANLLKTKVSVRYKFKHSNRTGKKFISNPVFYFDPSLERFWKALKKFTNLTDQDQKKLLESISIIIEEY